MAVSAYARCALLAAAASTAATCCGNKASAEVRSATAYRTYHLPGKTPSGLISNMRRTPFLGTPGGGIAHITPDYRVSVGTGRAGGVCHVKAVTVDMRFVITLPKANERAMSPATRNLWRAFVAFAKRHEETHRTIYLDCARRFLTKARALLPGSGCAGMKASIERLLAAEKRACDRRQQAFDLSEAARVLKTSLFRAADGHPAPREAVAGRSDVDTGYALPAR